MGENLSQNSLGERNVALRQSSKCSRIFRLSVILLLIMLAAVTTALAQAALESYRSKSDSPESSTQGKRQNLYELGKQLNNPISSVWNITTQSNMYFYKGDLSPAYRGQFVFNFQPVLPIPLTENWTLIPRPVIPILSNPYIRGVNSATGPLDWSRTGGFGDISLVTVLSPNIPGVILGFGPTFIFPTAPTHDLGQGKFQLGPAVVLGFISKKWVGGIFPQHWWSVAGSRTTPVTSQTNIQYFLARMLPGAWQISMSPNILIDWRADGKNQVTFPLGLGIGRTFRLGGVPIQSILQFQWMPLHPDDFGQRFNIRFNFVPVLPNLIKKPIFE
jgi:hypothetical protein